MHRSGTSAVAAALEALGLDVGAPDARMAADAANPAGYFELQEIGDLNDEILDALGGGWDCPPPLTEGWELDPTMTPYFRRAAAIVGTQLSKSGWVVKDPRISVLLPLWRRAVLDRCAAVLIVRDPMEVAWSMALRNGMPILTGLALWADYNRRALGGLSGLPVHVCAYGDLVSDPVTSLTAISASLSSWNELPAATDIAVAAALVKPELRRNTWPRDNADAIEVPGEIERLVKFLADLDGAHSSFDVGQPPASPWEHAVLAERRSGVLRLRTELQMHDEAARAREAVADTVRAELEHRLTRVQDDLAEVQGRRREAERALRAATHRLDSLDRRLPMRIARALRLRRPPSTPSPTDPD